MIEIIILYIQSIISEYGAWGVFFATLIEEVVAPVPSPLVPISAGFFLLMSDLSIVEILLKSAIMIALPVAVGISIGSSIVYALGFFGGKPVIEKSKKWTGINWQDIENIQSRFTKGMGDEITLFILRVLPVVPGVGISGFCGVIRYSFKKFIVITFIGSFIRAFILGILGWQVGELYMTYAETISKSEKYIFVVVLILAIFFLGYHFIFKKKNKSSN